MASLHLDVPEQFDFCSSDDWPRCNKIFERARFNKRDQLCGELAEQYITVLYQMAERCEYGDLTSEMI